MLTLLIRLALGLSISSLGMSKPLDDFVRCISLAHNPDSIEANSEYYGLVYQIEKGRYRHTVNRGKEDEDQIKINISSSGRGDLVAVWHTHGEYGRDKKYFSSHDVNTSKLLGVPIYMMDSKYIFRVFNPSDSTISSSRSSKFNLPAGGAKGSIIKKGGVNAICAN
tara:strand:- start:53 stop:550 length:498 start_codon:yes stop_codon:yes gene_type:complete